MGVQDGSRNACKERDLQGLKLCKREVSGRTGGWVFSRAGSQIWKGRAGFGEQVEEEGVWMRIWNWV